MSREFSAVKAGIGMFAAAPVIAGLCPAINAVAAGGSLDGILPAGATQKVAQGMASVASGAQYRVQGLLDGLRGKGLESSIGESLFPRGFQPPSLSFPGVLDQKLGEMVGMAKRGLEGAI